MNPEDRPRPVFSLWAWTVLSFYLVVNLGGFEYATTPAQWAFGIGISIVVHLVLLAAYVGIGALERATAHLPPLRWAIVAVMTVGVGVGRPSLITALQELVGMDLIRSDPPERFALNTIAIGVGNVLVYSLIASLTRADRSRRRLLAVTERLDAQTARIDATASRIAEDYRQQVRAPILDGLGALVSRDLPPRELSDELRWVAHAVVRPLSHRASTAELHEALERVDVATETPPSVPAAAGRRRRNPSSQIVSAPAWLTAVFALAIMVPGEIAVNDLAVGLPLSITATAVAFAGGILIRLVPLPAATAPAIALLSLLHLTLGTLLVAVLIGPFWTHHLSVYYLVLWSLAYAVVAIVLSVIWSVVAEVRNHQEQVAAALAVAQQRALHASQDLATLSRAISRVLHNEVQGDIIATSLQLRLGTAGPDTLGELMERVERLLADPLESDGDGSMSPVEVRDGIQASLEAWSLAIELSVDVEPSALERLAEHPRAAAVAHDALTEGLTNAVRHGRTDRASVAIRADPARHGDTVGVVVEVANPGRLTAQSTDGMGLRDLDARAGNVSLAQRGPNVVLRVLV